MRFASEAIGVCSRGTGLPQPSTLAPAPGLLLNLKNLVTVQQEKGTVSQSLPADSVASQLIRQALSVSTRQSFESHGSTTLEGWPLYLRVSLATARAIVAPKFIAAASEFFDEDSENRCD
eukprot:scaffold1726_cov103-Skeletonema_dohrnii-CCMP3373.AAC.5